MYPYYPVTMAYPDYMYSQYHSYYSMPNLYGLPQPYMTNMNPNGYSGGQGKKKNTGHKDHVEAYTNGVVDPESLPPETRTGTLSPSTASETKSAQTNTTTTEHAPNLAEKSPELLSIGVQDPELASAATPVLLEKPPSTEISTDPAFPVYFNTNADEMKKFFHAADTSANSVAIANANANTNTNIESVAKVLANCSFTVHRSRYILIDHQNGSVSEASYELPASKTSTGNLEKQTAPPKPAAGNWALVLQSTAKKAPKKVVAKPKTTTRVSSPDASPAATPGADNIPQRLGYLVLKMLFDPRFHLSAERKFDVPARGLTNTGNICYMNAILQCLMFCSPFNRSLHCVKEKSVGQLGESTNPLLDATISFVDDFVNVSAPVKSNSAIYNADGIVIGRPLSPESLYMKLIENEKFQHLQWGEQEDAEEFLNNLLEGLHEEFVVAGSILSPSDWETLSSKYTNELATPEGVDLRAHMKHASQLLHNFSTRGKHLERNEISESEEDTEDEDTSDWAEVGSGKRTYKKHVVEVEPSPITQIFGGRFRSVLTIPTSKETRSITIDPFRCIQLDILVDGVSTIENALRRFNEPEKISFRTESGRDVLARKQTYIEQLPQVLVLQLKRFSFQRSSELAEFEAEEPAYNGTIEKVMKVVQFGLELTVPPECLAPVRNKASADTYRLISVVYHHGRQAEGGHYTCDVKRDDNRWLRIDDTSVETVDASNVIQEPEAKDKSAYLLFYELKK